PRLFALIGCVAFCAFTGDIVVDSIGDACADHCVAQASQSDSHHEKTPCSHCSCAVHNGTVIAANSGVHVSADFQASACVPPKDPSAPAGLPAAIAHPPQPAQQLSAGAVCPRNLLRSGFVHRQTEHVLALPI